MMKTSPLRVVYSTTVPQGLFIIHPNEGAELGMITKQHHIELSTNVTVQDFLKGDSGETLSVLMDLRNECPKGELHLNSYYGKIIGTPDKAVLLYDGTRVYFHALAG
jgi:hypothetical protein